MRYAESMLTDVDKRIRKGKQRLALSVKDALVRPLCSPFVSIIANIICQCPCFQRWMLATYSLNVAMLDLDFLSDELSLSVPQK